MLSWGPGRPPDGVRAGKFGAMSLAHWRVAFWEMLRNIWGNFLRMGNLNVARNFATFEVNITNSGGLVT